MRVSVHVWGVWGGDMMPLNVTGLCEVGAGHWGLASASALVLCLGVLLMAFRVWLQEQVMDRWSKMVVPKLAEDGKSSAQEEASMLKNKSTMGRSLEETAMQVGAIFSWWYDHHISGTLTPRPLCCQGMDSRHSPMSQWCCDWGQVCCGCERLVLSLGKHCKTVCIM